METAVTLSTSDVEHGDAAAYWRDLICATFVEVAVRPVDRAGFAGLARQTEVAGMSFVRLTSHAQQVARTPAYIAREREHHLLANIQLSGRGRLVQDDRRTVLEPGSLTFVDSSKPYKLDFEGEFEQLVVRVPVSMLPRRTLTGATAVALGGDGPGRLVTDFLLGLDRTDPVAARELAPHAVGLLDTALGWAAGRTDGPQLAITRERVRRFMRRHASDPGLDAAAVAAACGISRRTLFRALADDEPFTSLLRRYRVERAQQMLLSNPRRSLAAVAAESGFAGTTQLHRAFQRVTGDTPGCYRSSSLTFATNCGGAGGVGPETTLASPTS
ncbi:AraC family transcriptional regulator [Kutzneria buriramensis]|uniref:AraC family transcriptional regulator n=1 Tax=Kutzneria buriramensis TaxID=1045776 RepID=UPI001B86C3CE|nr:AraC family transcriptional regulator [Kutzneria buriramensis]